MEERSRAFGSLEISGSDFMAWPENMSLREIADRDLILNGVNLKPYIANPGYSVEYVLVTGNNGGTMRGGTRVEDILARKAKITVTVNPLHVVDMYRLLLTAFPGGYYSGARSPFSLSYFDPLEGDYRTVSILHPRMEPVTYLGWGTDEKEYWNGARLTLEEA